MPIKLRIYLEGDPPAHPFQHMAGLRKLVLDWLALAGGAALATTVHDANQPNPYAISPIWFEEGRLWFEVGALPDQLGPAIQEGAARYGRDLRLGPQRFRVVDLEISEQVSWEQLLESSCGASGLSVQLVTPTAHHAPGPYRKAVVLPAPETYFGSWFNRWNLCCPVPFPESLIETVREQVAIGACRGQTKMVQIDDVRRFIGFVGEVTFRVLKPELMPPEQKAALAALVRFSNYCGTGVETTRGMGQTRAIEAPANLKRGRKAGGVRPGV
jgi:CRISPR-associated endoribonuclease Cas6